MPFQFTFGKSCRDEPSDLSVNQNDWHEYSDAFRLTAARLSALAAGIHGDLRTKGKACVVGFDHYLVKPIDFQKLNSLLDPLSKR